MNRPGSTRRKVAALDETRLAELALAYVGRFATTRAKLRQYLSRKLRERGWDGSAPPDIAAISERLARQGYIDDAGYAMTKARTLTSRGYGRRRVAQSLRAAGVDEPDGAEALDHADSEAVRAAIRFAERRRLGPFASAPPADRKARERSLAALIRAGHDIGLSRALVDLPPKAEIDVDELVSRLGLSDQ